MARAADRLIERLKEDIHSGTLRPGDQLEEANLAARFGVSRTPVREAVRSLVDSGLLEMKSRKGAIVRVLGAKELIDLFEVAAELEGMAARLAAQRLTKESAKQIEAGLDMCRDAAERDDAEAYGQANLAFHKAIHLASGNARLIEQLEQISGHMNPYRSMPYNIRGRLPRSTEEHAEIMAAIFENEAGRADDLMRDHMMLQGQRVPMLLQSMENK
ncbi:GntR family transcriptional regulator [Tritonibacter mobilis]|uniref:GntR family transcriptional regulator n=1 Tax=Tritonibacter mobilis TaxID=379347 RepID=UPI003A5BAC75